LQLSCAQSIAASLAQLAKCTINIESWRKFKRLKVSVWNVKRI